MINPLKLNDWEIKNFTILIISIQIVFLGLFYINNAVINTPIFSEFLGVIYTLTIPGYLLLRIMRIHNLSSTESILYAIGLSISSTMFIGLLMNIFYPLIGINNPISLLNIVLTFLFFNFLLIILSYVIDKDYNSNKLRFQMKKINTNKLILLTLIPFISIFGSYLQNLYHLNYFLIIFFIIMAITIFLVVENKIPKEFLPYTIYILSLSILFHSSLISPNIVEWADLTFEYKVAEIVISNQIWNIDTNISNLYSTLSICIFTPVLSILTKIGLTWIFKIVFPFIYSFLPVGLYHIYKKQTDSMTAFLACMLFISTFSFFTDMLGLNRQQLGELFLVLIILILLNKNLEKIKKNVLIIIFSFALIVSHYALSYIIMIAIIISGIILYFRGKNNIHKFDFVKSNILSSGFILLFITFTISWYMYTSSGSVITDIVNISNNIVSHIYTDLFNPSNNQGLEIITRKSSTLINLTYKIIYLTSQVFILIGVLIVFLKRKKFTKINNEYFGLSITFLIVGIAGILVPFFAATINTSRLYHISLIFLAIFSIIGADFVFGKLKFKNPKKIVSIFIIIYLLFNSGVMHLLVGENASYALNPDKIDRPTFDQSEKNSLIWLKNKGVNEPVYADLYTSHLVYQVFNEFNYLGSKNYEKIIQNKNYIFLGKYNLIDKKVYLGNTRLDKDIKSIEIFEKKLNYKNLIYDSGISNIYL